MSPYTDVSWFIQVNMYLLKITTYLYLERLV